MCSWRPIPPAVIWRLNRADSQGAGGQRELRGGRTHSKQRSKVTVYTAGKAVCKSPWSVPSQERSDFTDFSRPSP